MRADAYFSRAARVLRESTIRRLGDLRLSTPDLVSLAPGYPDPTLFAWTEIRAVADDVLGRAEASALQYGPSRGDPLLLEALPHIAAGRGILCARDETLVTTGSQQAIDLCVRAFADPGDAVLVEQPTYTGALTAFAAGQLRVTGIDRDADGLDVDRLDHALLRERHAGQRVAFAYVVPNFQNPTGGLMPLDRRRQLLEWASRRDVLLIEDDPYGALYFDDITHPREVRPLKADDAEGRVVYASSFSKTIAPGLRIAWVVASPAIVARLEVLKQSADLCSSALDQRIVYELWERGVLERQLPALRAAYRVRRQTMEATLDGQLGDLVSWATPRGGFFIWIGCPPAVDTDALLARALALGVAYVPGSAFYPGRGPRVYARLAFSEASPERMTVGIARLARAVKETLDATARPPGPAG